MDVDLNKLKNFNALVKEANNMSQTTSPPSFVIIKGDNVEYKKTINLYDMIGFQAIIALGVYQWKNGPYFNESAKLLGMFDSELNLTESILLDNGYRITGIKFIGSSYSYYDEFEPVLQVTDPHGVSSEIKEDTKENSPWTTIFKTLIDKARNLESI